MTFLMGRDSGSTNAFYASAANYFPNSGGNKTITPTQAQGRLSLEDVFATLTAAKPAPSVINIVCHAEGFGDMSFPMTIARRDGPDHEDSTGVKDLVAPDAPLLNVKNITGKAQVVIYGCDIGRSSMFVRRLAERFGNPLQIFAPRRVAAFLNIDGVWTFRLARTWSVPRKILGTIPSSNTDAEWPDFHARFIAAAKTIFGPKADIALDKGGTAALATSITTKSFNTAYTFANGSVFFEEGVSAQIGVVTVANPLVNGDPPPPIYPQIAAEVDDTWVVTRLTDAEGIDNGPPGWRDYNVLVLATIIDKVPDFTDGFSFLSMYTAPQIAPAKPNPAGSSGGAVPPSPTGDRDSLTDQLLAAGLSQTDLDPLLATIAAPSVAADPMLDADPDVAQDDDPEDAGDDEIGQPESVEDV